MTTAIVWFRRDLRLRGNPALAAAIAGHARVLPVYIHAADEDGDWPAGGASRSWLHHALEALDASLRGLGSRLVLAKGPTEAALTRLVEVSGAQAVYWNRLYTPTAVARDRGLKAQLRARGLDVTTCNGALLYEPWEVLTGAGDPYRVFTPYWRRAAARLEPSPPIPTPTTLADPGIEGLSLAALGLKPPIPWDRDFYAEATPGEVGAQAALQDFLDRGLRDYANGRDLPARPGTSRLSAHLHFGEISVRQVANAVLAIDPRPEGVGAAFLRELGWRDFSAQLLYHYPHTPDQPLNAAYAAFPWADVDPSKLRAWQQGRTGIPIIDAGMRQLWQSGWMHNRVRMIVASFLTKNLRYPWQLGARWFWDTLVDADLASNTQGWQWSGGCGADAAPYFRIFNPVTQGERFDPAGDYVRRWVPELRGLGPKSIHQPWTMGGVRGYPAPIVDLKQSRDAALAAFQQLRARTAVAAS
jgi:deoxyribodipyrimidine photo-lyase